MDFIRSVDMSRRVAEIIFFIAKATYLFASHNAVEQAIVDGTLGTTLDSSISIVCCQCDYVSIFRFLLITCI